MNCETCTYFVFDEEYEGGSTWRFCNHAEPLLVFVEEALQ